MLNRILFRSLFAIFGTLFMSNTAFAEIRMATEYTCYAFNPMFGFAQINYSQADQDKTHLIYGFAKNAIKGGELWYNTEVNTSFPSAVLVVEVNGRPVTAHMVLSRPFDMESDEATLAGITYITVAQSKMSFFLAWPLSDSVLDGLLATLEIPLPAGYLPTSAVTCRVKF